MDLNGLDKFHPPSIKSKPIMNHLYILPPLIDTQLHVIEPNFSNRKFRKRAITNFIAVGKESHCTEIVPKFETDGSFGILGL